MEARACISGGRPLRGAPELPVDRSALELALVLAGLGQGTTQIELSPADRAPGSRRPARAMRACLCELGVAITESESGFVVQGVGLHGLSAPRAQLDAGTSPAALALSVALLSGQAFGTRVRFERKPPCAALLADALRARGAQARAVADAVLVAPLIAGEALGPIEHMLPVSDPHAKAGVLLSGLFTAAPTAVAEPLLSADHIERMLSAFGVPLRRLGSMSGFDPAEWSGALVLPSAIDLPRDSDVASGIAAIASCLPQSRVVLDHVGVNPTRIGVLEALRLLGARYLARSIGDTVTQEPLARAVIEHGASRGGIVGGELPLRAGAAAASLCMLGVRAARRVELELQAFTAQPLPWPDVRELLEAFGVRAELGKSSLVLGPASIQPARVAVGGDPQLAWLAISLAAVAEGESVIAELPELDEAWQALLGVLSQLGTEARIEWSPATMREQAP